MKFTLIVNGEEKIFTVPFIKGRVLRNALKLNKKLGEKELLDDETLDELIIFICSVFDNQFTLDDVLDGLPAQGMFVALQGVLMDVVTMATEGVPVHSESDGASNPKNG